MRISAPEAKEDGQERTARGRKHTQWRPLSPVHLYSEFGREESGGTGAAEREEERVQERGAKRGPSREKRWQEGKWENTCHRQRSGHRVFAFLFWLLPRSRGKWTRALEKLENYANATTARHRPRQTCSPTASTCASPAWHMVEFFLFCFFFFFFFFFLGNGTEREMEKCKRALEKARITLGLE